MRNEVYHTGHLGADRDKNTEQSREIDDAAIYALHLYELGVVNLVQRRLTDTHKGSPAKFDYIMQYRD